ncbi:MAG: hypothetical protein AABM66_09790 [Actinomycetota bacterium]
MTVLKVLAVPLVIVILASTIVGIGIHALDVSGQVAGLCFVGLAVLGGILGGRAAEKWPVSSPDA